MVTAAEEEILLEFRIVRQVKTDLMQTFTAVAERPVAVTTLLPQPCKQKGLGEKIYGTKED